MTALYALVTLNVSEDLDSPSWRPIDFVIGAATVFGFAVLLAVLGLAAIMEPVEPDEDDLAARADYAREHPVRAAVAVALSSAAPVVP